ncbi:hypothetical protein [Arcanobacterium phocae]|uniref:hypothetical protein n=1 Tax=Arcanobacterium phocae TaxID=131112 RepID=UPI001C0ECAEF|nr:hypothetical protein [Arcanobacterium phocae]
MNKKVRRLVLIWLKNLFAPSGENTDDITDVPDQVEKALSELGLSHSVIDQPLQAGEYAAKNITSFHPKTAAGLARWMETVAIARQELVGLNTEEWRVVDKRLKPLLENPEREIMLSFVAGNQATGKKDSFPNSRRKQGRTSAELHSGSFTIIGEDALPGIDEKLQVVGVGNEDQLEVRVLLYYRDKDELRAEISLPQGVKDGLFTGWKRRIILEPLQFDSVQNVRPLDVGGGDIDFEIIALGE